MTEFNLPDSDDSPWLNLSPQDIEQLRNQKKELTDYGKQKIRKLMNRSKMTDEQIDTMLQMHRYLMRCEIRHAFDMIGAENGNQDYSVANRSEAFNDTKWEEFAKWFKMIRDE